MTSAKAIVGSRGLLAIVPAAAIDHGTGLVAIEVGFVLQNKHRLPIVIRLTIGELECCVRTLMPTGGVQAVRQSIVDQAETRIRAEAPALAAQIAKVSSISWICHEPRRREPFWR